ncbi:hypothetical protein HHK36_010343 [Tetracentron sinense]|uniref:HTH La-type RNA-binding domain-containing protein n=1 Tax=Tetracentron sinense TaxID=13715 RepID=A0A835DMA2_TETSI|nr:hypothetical protein HHK36_010343 [Tetracentron sinense]
MAAADDSAINNHSPRASGISNDGLSSPQLRRRNISSPWAQIVRGEPETIPSYPSSPSSSSAISHQEQIPYSDSSPVKASSSLPDNSAVEAQQESSDNGNSNVGRGKKPAWNRLSNGVVEVGPVMGAFSWPALSESARASPKSPSDSLKVLSDGSVSVSQGPVIASSPQKQATGNANPNSTLNHGFPVRQNSIKRGGSGGGSSSDGFTQPPPPPPPPPPLVETPQNNSGTPGLAVPDSSPRYPLHRGNNWETGPRGGFVSQPHSGNDHPQQRNSFRRPNGGPHLRGDGPHHNNYGGKRDGWNPHRSFNSRDVYMQQQRVVPRGYIRTPPPNSTPFIGPPAVRPFGNPMGFSDMSPLYYVPALSPESLRSVPFVGHASPPALFVPLPDPHLCAMLVKQIDFYFSNENLIKDTFLRKKMDEQGWVPITLIAGFPRVAQMSNNIQYVLDAVKTSTVLEVQGDKVRKRDGWMEWILPPSNRFPTVSGPQFQDPHTEAVLSRRSSGELTNQSQASNEEGMGKVTDQAGPDEFLS